MKSEMVLVVGVALVDASVPLGGRVDLHLRLDSVLPAPELSDLLCKDRNERNEKNHMEMGRNGTFLF